MIIFISGCSTVSNQKLVGHAEDLKSYERFGVCYGYGCKHYQKTGLTDDEWLKVKSIFSPEVVSAREERQRIAQATALLEQFVGPKTGTDTDKRGAVIVNFSTRNQMDCIDEAFNSTTYLYLMRQAGLIKFHTLGGHLRRNVADLSYPHSTATIHEIGKEIIVEGDGHYVVDSWFHENGAVSEIIPANVWKKNRWAPKQRKLRYNFSAS